VILKRKPYIKKQGAARADTRAAWNRDEAVENERGKRDMGRLLKLLLFLLVLGFAGLVGYAYLGDISPEQTDVSDPVDLNAD
jgi:hypothetical protein